MIRWRWRCSQAYLCKSLRVLIYKNDSYDGRNINFIHRSYSFTRGRRSLSFLVISVSFVYVCHSLSLSPRSLPLRRSYEFLSSSSSSSIDWVSLIWTLINQRFSFIFISSRFQRTWFQLLYMGCTGSKHELSLEDLQFLKAHTSYSEKKIKSWYKGFMVRCHLSSFDWWDLLLFFFFQRDCPNGELTRESFIQIYKQFFPKGRAENFCEHVFRAFDSGKSTRKEKKSFSFLSIIFRSKWQNWFQRISSSD